MLHLVPVVLALLACGVAPPQPVDPPPAAEPSAPARGDDAPAASLPDHLAAAVAAPGRPEEDRARDAARHPGEVLAFFGIQPGMAVADLMTGRGYYAEILAHAVGPGGRVVAQNNAYVVEKFADGPLGERLTRLAMPHVVRADRELDALGLPDHSLDAALLVLFWHDTYWMELDRPAVLAEIRRVLKPGGTFGVVDHHAAVGSGARDVKTLHRVEEQLVLDELAAAGFVLEARSDLLRHPEDDRTRNVFDEGLRGLTDRFVLRFRAP